MFYGLALDYTISGNRYCQIFTDVDGTRVHNRYIMKDGKWCTIFTHYEWSYNTVKIYFNRCKRYGGTALKSYNNKQTYHDFKEEAKH